MNKIKEILPKNVETRLIFFVNGKKVVEPHPDPEWTLLWYLRRKLYLTGTKYGCGEGGCGACTVMLSQYIANEDRLKHIAVNACLTPVCAVHGLAITTVEGIGSTRDRLHPVQERIAKAHGSQCGFCTPGIVMSMYSLLRNKNKIDYSDIETALQGNLCRCTGYRPIIEGFKTFIEGWEIQYANGGQTTPCLMGKDCCRVNGKEENQANLFNKSEFLPYDPTQEPIFPPELKVNNKLYASYLYYEGENVTWIRPDNIKDLLLLKKSHPQSKIVAGNTEIGVEMKFKNLIYPILLCPSLITQMYTCTISKDSVILGAALSLTDVSSFIDTIILNYEKKAEVLKEIKEMLHWFAGNQIRNVATLAGNIVTASPISDLNPILMACSASLTVCSLEKGNRTITVDDAFFKGYRKTILDNDEVVVSIQIPFTTNQHHFRAYKQAKRKDDDISIVTSAFNVRFEEDNNIVTDAKLCYGGMASTTISAIKTSSLMKGMQWNKEMLNLISDSLNQELQLDISVPGGMADYRKSLCISLFFKFYLHVLQNLNKSNGYCVPQNQISGADDIPRLEPSSSQYFDIQANARKASDAVGKPVPHASAFKQATGEAIYCDDIIRMEGELYLKFIFSSEAHAKIVSVDASKALMVPDVVAFLSAADLDENCNMLGSVVKDEKIFYKDTVTSRSCIIGAIAANNEIAAKKGRDLVKVIYERLDPVIITLEDAIKYRSFFPGYPRTLKKGDVTNSFSTSKFVKKGCLRSGAQEHFYLETLSAFAVWKEDELEIISTSQNPADVGAAISHALRIPNNKIISKVKRIGGGFGGKETRCCIIAVPVGIAAYKLKKPVRAVLDRDEDMQCSGYRHPVLINYEVAFNDDGKITGAVFNIYVNAGFSMDISCSLVERIIVHVDNTYFIPNIEVNAYLCKTNLPSNTAFRGFGSPKAMFAAETVIRDIADTLGRSYEEIAEKNLYKEGDLTHYNQLLTYCTLDRCWNECLKNSNYWVRRREVEEFNKLNRWKKKGISMVPTKYGISFQTDFLMQGAALLHVYRDGSVLISIGGVEMGQGLYTKMIQVASRALEVDISKIHISEMSSDKVPNSTPTAASMSSDLCGMAVVNACIIIKERLKPYVSKKPDGKWEDWVLMAFFDRVSLSTTGFYCAPKIEYDKEKNFGNLFEYFTYGVACSEVVIDCLTGDHQVLGTDIVMDVGESLNPAIDIGQIEGAFMQGYGYYTLEEMIFSPTGELYSKGPGAYKIPGFSDVPKVFNVSLLKGAPNPRAVYSSKAVGEPPLFLAASVFFAIKEAVRSARADAGVSTEFLLEMPATCAKIRMACEDHITEKVKPTITRNGQPWNVTP